MNSLFNYTTLKVDLKKETKTLVVELHRPASKNAINIEVLFELETLLSWATNKIEIASILFTSSQDTFSIGADEGEMINMDFEKLTKFQLRVKKIIYSLFHLPQTIIFDLRKSTIGLAAELAVGADIRLAQTGCIIQFDHLNKGLVPNSGGIGLLAAIVPRSFAKNWVLGGRPISTVEQRQSGFVHRHYERPERESIVEGLLEKIGRQGQVQRMQAKLAFLLSIQAEIEKAMAFETNVAKAGLITEDWKECIKAKEEDRPAEMTPARDMGKVIQLLKNKSRNQNSASGSEADVIEFPNNDPQN